MFFFASLIHIVAMIVMMGYQPSTDHLVVVCVGVCVGVGVAYAKTLFNLHYYTLSLGSRLQCVSALHQRFKMGS
ncbi:hypothetical protein VNO77_28814 [Canavalia gladiata]|uniref:Uncharacterized protein n=1 Tax=Canavalia gladiata TaxID=3824 RepID=A0AAN9KZN8_CANGL